MMHYNPDLFKILEKRRSIRRYINKSVSMELILDIIKYAALAPSPKNRQPWKFLILKDGYKDKFIDFAMNCLQNLKDNNKRFGSLEISLKAMKEAYALIVVSNPYDKEDDYKLRWEKSDLQAIGAVIQNLLLAITAYDLGSLWINDIYFIREELENWLLIKNNIYAVVAIGYADEKPFNRPRKNINEIVEIREFSDF